MLFANLCGIWCAASFCPPLDHNLETQLTDVKMFCHFLRRAATYTTVRIVIDLKFEYFFTSPAGGICSL
ncbi:hypothetical protein SETIT_3G098600v2 [Setaria italica]|uniref:Uncharacterized protein n=2 Tax=Setaria TaxID=4554 RepID=A0A368QE18_SETIT|nr:hypothetical protein SETIT_3G098600v2 [Setaria italica]TKW25181.1 hypothetical protein SEVIR_3G099100v2 [Setaria viridis]